MSSLIGNAVQELQDPSDPTEYPEYGAPKVAGNIHDDDAQIIDDTLTPNPNPRLPEPSSKGEPIPPKAKGPKKLLTGTILLAESTVPTQLLNFDPNRCDLTVIVSAYENLTAPQTVTATGTPVTGPGAFTILTSIPATSLPEGWYDVVVVADISGTTAAADDNNVRLVIDSTPVYVIEIETGTTGAHVETPPIRVYVNGSNQLRVGTIGAATGTATYAAAILATRLEDTSQLSTYSPVRIASDVASLQGASVAAVVDAASDAPTIIHLPEYDGPLYAVLPPGSIVPTVSISWMATSK